MSYNTKIYKRDEGGSRVILRYGYGASFRISAIGSKPARPKGLPFQGSASEPMYQHQHAAVPMAKIKEPSGANRRAANGWSSISIDGQHVVSLKRVRLDRIQAPVAKTYRGVSPRRTESCSTEPTDATFWIVSS
jgi:hypothetical protein